MKQLIEDYERRLKTAETMLERKNYGSIAQAERIKTKASCYRTFLAELKQQCNIANVVGRSEQLVCECCGDSLVEEQGDWCQECLDNPSRVITN